MDGAGDAGRGLRRRRPRRRRPHRPLRQQRAGDQLFWNDGYGRSGRAPGFGHRLVRLALRRGGGDVNGDGRPDLYVGGYTENNGAIPGPRQASRPTTSACATSSSSTSGTGASGGRWAGRARPEAVRPLARRDLHRPEQGRPPRPPRRKRRGSEPCLPEREGRAARLPLRREREAVRPCRPECRHGHRRQRPQLRVLPELPVRDGNSRGQEHAVFRAKCADEDCELVDARRQFAEAFGTNFTGWGDSFADLANNGAKQSRPRERRYPRQGPGEERGQDPGDREGVRQLADATRLVGADRSRASTAEASPPPTSTTTGTSTSRSAPLAAS